MGTKFHWSHGTNDRISTELKYTKLLSKILDVDDATMVRVDLERKIETLREELEYNRKVHNEEMEDLKEQISSQESIIEMITSLPPIFAIFSFFENRQFST